MKRSTVNRVISALILFAMIVMMIPASAINVAAYEPGDYTSNGIKISNDYIQFRFNGGSRLALAATGGNPDSNTDDNKILLYGSMDGGTSDTIINVGGQTTAFNSSTCKISDDRKSL